MNYSTPGVYVEEVSLLPPSVAQVETAIPAFIGYTQKAQDLKGDALLNTPTRIKSLLEYEVYFGESHKQQLEVTLAPEAPFTPQTIGFNGAEQPYRMYQALQLYFGNGGGPCFIVSTGDFDTDSPTPSLDAIEDYDELKAGLDAARKIDEITLLVFPEADRLNTPQYYDLYKDVLSQCYDLKDRFGVFDVLPDDKDANGFRDNIGVNNLSYGAAYYPYLDSSIVHPYDDSTVTFAATAADVFKENTLAELNTVATVLVLQKQIAAGKIQVDEASGASASLTKPGKYGQYRIALAAAERALKNAEDAIALLKEPDDFSSTEFDEAKSELADIKDLNLSQANNVPEIEDGLTALVALAPKVETAAGAILAQVNTDQAIGATLNADIATHFTNSFQTELKNLLDAFTVSMPPSSAIVGIYARTDNSRGVWKAPANVSINLVNGTMVKLDNDDNGNLNIHSSGKSINAIRAFTGKGTLVWGARTLDGNSNEWRYVPVRRFFNMVEESVKKASEQSVFEPNDANTWIKVKAMIENFLVLQWRAGALMGAKAEEAFFVNVGLGTTMTQDDVLNGKMIVEIGMAAVRPAEFIILRFSHKMLEA